MRFVQGFLEKMFFWKAVRVEVEKLLYFRIWINSEGMGADFMSKRK